MNASTIMGIFRWARRFRTSIVLFIISLVFIRYAPIIPHAPYCWSSSRPTIYYDTHLSEAYRLNLTYIMIIRGLTFVSYDDRIFITLSDWMDDEEWILNGMGHSVDNVGESAFEAFPEGETGRLYREWKEADTAYFKDHGDLDIRHDAWCALMKNVVTPP